jgi:hypothetical protein
MSQERTILVAADAGISIRTKSDVADLVGASFGVDGLILTEGELGEDFFNLRTGLAGELLQKLVNYRVRAAIVVPEPELHGERFAELAREHGRHAAVRFVRTMEEATSWVLS